MYLIKSFNLNYEPNSQLVTKDGVNAFLIIDGKFKFLIKNEYWGKTIVKIEDSIDFSKIPQNSITPFGRTALLSYVNNYDIKQIGNNFIELYLNIGSYEENKIDGYMIFIKHGDKIVTNGKKLFSRFPNEIVAVIKEGEYIEFSNHRLEVINNKLVC